MRIPARHQHLLRGQALAAAGGLGADRPRPARPAARAAQPGPGRSACRRGRAPVARPTPCSRHSRPRPRAALHLHRPGGLFVEPAPVARMRPSAKPPHAWFRAAIGFTAISGGQATGGHVGCFSVPDWRDLARRTRSGPASRHRWRTWPSRRAPAAWTTWWSRTWPSAREPSTMAMIRELLDDGDADRVPIRLCLDVGHMCRPGTSGADRDPYAWIRSSARRARHPAPAVGCRRRPSLAVHARYNAVGPDLGGPRDRGPRRGRRRGDARSSWRSSPPSSRTRRPCWSTSPHRSTTGARRSPGHGVLATCLALRPLRASRTSASARRSAHGPASRATCGHRRSLEQRLRLARPGRIWRTGMGLRSPAKSATLAQVALRRVAQPPVGAEVSAGSGSGRSTRGRRRICQRPIGEQADRIAQVLLVDLPDLEFGQEQVGQVEGRAGVRGDP